MMLLLIDVSRLESGSMPVHKSECELNQLAQTVFDSLTPMAANRRLTLSATKTVRVECDTDIVRRILENLVNNALKFTPSGGVVEVSLACSIGAALITVRDSGCGVPPEYREKIFEKFGQVQGEAQQLGTGLGLAFCKLAVTAHGGTIGVKSELGQGSTFWFTLPNARSVEMSRLTLPRGATSTDCSEECSPA